VSRTSEARTNKRSVRHIDQATRADDGVLANDRASLAFVRDLQVMLVDVVQALQDDAIRLDGEKQC
jgi:hypothetical protein